MAQVAAASHSGAGAEVIQATGNFSWSWAGWKSSPSHYGILTSAGATQIGCGAVKVVRDADARALYFSRAPIPFDRDGAGDVVYRQHVGVYAYTRDALRAWVARRRWVA